MNADPAKTTESQGAPGPRRVVEDVTCLLCGCLCDDLTVVVEDDSVVEVRNACEAGRRWFAQQAQPDPSPAASVDGQAVELREAVARAADLLSAARAPVVFGLTRTVTETVRDALELAEAVGARVVLNRAAADLGRVAAFQRQGRVAATLGEVKNRADVVVFWGADPARTHPRHGERYSVEAKGRFIPEGRGGRTVVVVDAEKTATAEGADVFIPLPPQHDVAALVALRLWLGGKTLGRDQTRTADGFDLAPLERLVPVLRQARYGAFFFQGRGPRHDRSGADWEAASRLVRDLNDVTRFVLLGLGGPGNLAGAEAALTWQGGFLQGVDYRLGLPSPLDDLATLDELLAAREPDVILSVADGLPEDLSDAARAHLAAIPRIVIGPGATATTGPARTVAIATAAAGFDAGGTVARADGVGLPVRTVRAATRPSDQAVVRGIRERLRESGVKLS